MASLEPSIPHRNGTNRTGPGTFPLAPAARAGQSGTVVITSASFGGRAVRVDRPEGKADARDRPNREHGGSSGRGKRRSGRASLAGAGQLPGGRPGPLLPGAGRVHQGGEGGLSRLRGPRRVPRVR